MLGRGGVREQEAVPLLRAPPDQLDVDDLDQRLRVDVAAADGGDGARGQAHRHLPPGGIGADPRIPGAAIAASARWGLSGATARSTCSRGNGGWRKPTGTKGWDWAFYRLNGRCTAGESRFSFFSSFFFLDLETNFDYVQEVIFFSREKKK